MNLLLCKLSKSHIYYICQKETQKIRNITRNFFNILKERIKTSILLFAYLQSNVYIYVCVCMYIYIFYRPTGLHSKIVFEYVCVLKIYSYLVVRQICNFHFPHFQNWRKYSRSHYFWSILTFSHQTINLIFCCCYIL